MNDPLQEAYNYHMTISAMTDDPKTAEYHEGCAAAIEATDKFREGFHAGELFLEEVARRPKTVLTSAEQARPIVSEYLTRLYREKEPTEELYVGLPNGKCAELFPAYADDGGLIQIDFYDGVDSEAPLDDSHNFDKFRSKKRFSRNLANQVDEVLESLGLIKWGIMNAYVGEFWEKNGKPLTFSSKHLAQKYADGTQGEGGIEHDEKEAQVVIFEPTE